MIKIRPLEPGDLEGMHTLFKRSFGKDRSRGCEAWRYFETPYGVVPGAVAVEGDRIVASYTAWPTPLSIGGEKIKGAQSMDTMTDPEYRGKGLFPKVAMACYELMSTSGYEVVYGFPNREVYNGRVHRLNWDHTGNISMWKRLVLPRLLLPRPLAAAGRCAWGLFNPLANTRGWDIAEEGSAPADLEGLLAAGGPDRNRRVCQVQRDRIWLEWRYSPTSERDYVWVTLRCDGQIKALLVYRREAPHRLILAETIGNREALAAGIRHIVSKAEAARPVIVTTLTSDKATIEALCANGFIRRGHQMLAVRSLTNRFFRGNIHHHDGWRMFGGDIDVF